MDGLLSRVAMISMHTSPLDQPGTGDAGGMNVYVLELSRRLARQGIEVDIFTRATSSAQPPVVQAADGVTVHHITAGPFEGLTKGELPGQLCVFAREVLRAEAAQPLGHYDAVHSHYWLSGQVGALARDRWGVPLIHSMHTMAKVKNAALADGDTPEPPARVIGEEQVVSAADMLIANTDTEATQLIDLYDADPGASTWCTRASTWPCSRRGPRRWLARPCGCRPMLSSCCSRAGSSPSRRPDVLLRAVAVLLDRDPSFASRLVVPVVGGPSGSGLDHPESLAQLATGLGLDDVVRFVPPVGQSDLARWYSAATLVAVPSYNESFGLVAAEAQAAGTPVVAAAVGGLTTVVADEVSGLLVDGHDPLDWAAALERIVGDEAYAARLAAGAPVQAAQFSWERTAQATLDAYERARKLMAAELVS